MYIIHQYRLSIEVKIGQKIQILPLFENLPLKIIYYKIE